MIVCDARVFAGHGTAACQLHQYNAVASLHCARVPDGVVVGRAPVMYMAYVHWLPRGARMYLGEGGGGVIPT